MIPEPGGGERPLGTPTIRDRVAQTAAKLVVRGTAGGAWKG
jgi:RNA-directed DNA polymerase